MVHNSTLHVVYDTGNYTLASAQNSTPRESIPGLLASYAVLVGRVIIKKGDSTFTEIQSTFTTNFGSSLVTQHNDLSGIQGGEANQYFHSNQEINKNNTPEFAGVQITEE